MAIHDDYLDWVLGQLAAADGVSVRRMFGAFGLYHGGVFFGILRRNTLYFKVDDANRADYATRGMAAFRPYADGSKVSTSYFEVPADVIEDAEECVRWARKAIGAGAAAQSRGRGRKRPPR
jgi:DNA transformation protein and related proteins